MYISCDFWTTWFTRVRFGKKHAQRAGAGASAEWHFSASGTSRRGPPRPGARDATLLSREIMENTALTARGTNNEYPYAVSSGIREDLRSVRSVKYYTRARCLQRTERGRKHQTTKAHQLLHWTDHYTPDSGGVTTAAAAAAAAAHCLLDVLAEELAVEVVTHGVVNEAARLRVRVRVRVKG